MRSQLLTAGLAIVAAQAAVAQSDSLFRAAKTPSECSTAMTMWRNGRQQALRAEGKPLDNAAILRDAQALGRQCVARFDLAAVDVAQLGPLADVSIAVGDTARARAAVARAIAAPGLTQRQRGEAMLVAERVAMIGVDPFEGLMKDAEAIVQQLDALPDSLALIKISGHVRLLGNYEYADVDEGIRDHAQAIIDIGRRVRKTIPQVNQSMISGFESLARAAGDYLHADSALMILDAATKELADVPSAGRAFESAAHLYKLVGTRASPLRGERWVNAPDKPATISFDEGKVYLIQFTAHWCVPCRKSYPGLKAVHEQLKGQKFEIVFETLLYGNFAGKAMSAEEEIAADKEYYKEHHDLPFRVAINPSPGSARESSVEGQYRVGGIPQTVVIDKNGIIRQIVVGGDKGNEARLAALVRQLLAEK